MRLIRPAIVLLLGLTLLTGLAYPLLVTGFAQLIFPSQANGSLVMRAGRPVGSALIGQNFTAAGYFHGRPSATTVTRADGTVVPAPYNADNSGGSNLGPTSKALAARVAADVKQFVAANPGQPVPADLVTTSASGLDPDISPAAAYVQVQRIAAARHLEEKAVQALVARSVVGRTFGLLGTPHVNVLFLNLALDRLAGQAGRS
ncbi:potassium-transporting ATPase subunit KdpC [Acidisoma sp. C75]